MKVSSWDIPDVSESFASGCRVANTGLKNRTERAISLSDESRRRPDAQPKPRRPSARSHIYIPDGGELRGCGEMLRGVAAMPIRPFIQPGAFDPEAIAVMSEAFEAALKELHDTGQPDVVPEAIAGRIIAAAKFGERDPARLLAAALSRPRRERD